MRSQPLGALLLSLAALGLAGCWTSKTYEREVGAPHTEVERVLLPGPRRVEVTASRSGETLELELSRGHSCRRVEHTTVRRESVEETSLGAGTYIVGGTFGGLGLLATGADDAAPAILLLSTGAVIFALAATGTGTETKELPPARSSLGAGLEPCAGEPIANARVVVVSRGVTHDGTSDEAGRLALENVAPGPLRVVVDGQVANVHEVAWRPTRPNRAEPAQKPESPPPAASFPSTEGSAPPAPTPEPSPTPTTSGSAPPPPPPPPVKSPAPREPYAPLPPPPPKPPGARAPGE